MARNTEQVKKDSTAKTLTEKINDLKGLILSIVSILGLSFGLHTWLSENFVTKEHFDNSVNALQEKLDNEIASKMDAQFLILRKNINETEYNVLGTQVASIHVPNKFKLTPFELDNITKIVRKHCMLGKELGFVPSSTDCEQKVDDVLNNK